MISRLRARLNRWLTNPVVLFAAIFLVIASLTRLGLALFNGMQSVPLALWPSILLRGVWFDLAVLAWLVAPLLLYEVLLPKRVRTSRFHRLARYAAFVFAVFILLFGVVSEFTFWEEFSSRF
ncbi:MAG: hypothetical protein IV108_12570, partial [Burkholderiales bacterium]|nr:hypothetical protein [Burkholderiales bacterium]